jgi:hypothetical protein
VVETPPTLEESLGPDETVVTPTPPVETASDRVKKDFEKLVAEGVDPALALRLAMEGVSTAPVPAPAPAPVDTYTRPDDDYYVAPVPVGDSLDPGEEVPKSEFEDLKPVAQTGGLPVATDPVTTALGPPDVSEDAVADILGTTGQTASNSLENGTQLAAVDTGTVSDAGGGGGYLPFSVDVKGIPIYAESSLASTITPPSGYTLLSTEKADNKPFGSYYDAELNAWLTPLAPDDYAYPSESAPFDATTYTAPDDYAYPSESAPFDATTYTAPDDYVYPSESAPFDATTYTRPDDNYYYEDLPPLSDLPLLDVNSWGDVAEVNTDVLTRPDDNYYYEDLPPLSDLPLTDVGSPGPVTEVIADTPAPVDTGGGGGGAPKVTVKPTVKPTVTGGGGLPTSSYSDQTAVGGNLLRVGKMGQDMSRHELKQLYDNLVTNSSPNYGYVNDVNPEMVDILKANTLPFSAPQPNYSAYTGYAQGGPVQNLADGAQPDQSYAVRDTMAALKGLGALGFDGKPERPMLLKQGQMGGAHNSKVLPQLAALLRARGMTLAEGGQPDDHTHPNYDGMPLLRTGGLSGLGGKYVEGKGDGTSDDIAAMLANGEYVFSADVVAALGNGSNKAGAEELDRMVQAIRSRARSAPPDKLPPDAKSPLEYLKSSKGKKHG